MRRLLLALLVSLIALALAPVASATVNLTAVDVQVADHPGYVRVVVEFTDGDLTRYEPTLLDPEVWSDGGTRVEVAHRRIRTEAAPVTAQGVSVRLVQGTNRIVVKLTAARHRFKYVSYSVLASPERLVIDLWKARPPVPAAVIRNDGCLRFTGWSVSGRTVRASGRAIRQLFEGTLVVRVRARNGRLLAEKPLIANKGQAWSTMLRPAVVTTQKATLEVAVGSAKDGSLECLIQVAITLHPA